MEMGSGLHGFVKQKLPDAPGSFYGGMDALGDKDEVVTAGLHWLVQDFKHYLP